MLHTKQGFTLLELLIAAAIIGVLAVFATQSFRQTSSDIRAQNARANAKVIAMAVRMYELDHGDASVTSEFSMPANPPSRGKEVTGECDETGTVDLSTLINCGYLEYRDYLGKDFSFTYNDGEVCITPKENSRITNDPGTYCTDGAVDHEQ